MSKKPEWYGGYCEELSLNYGCDLYYSSEGRKCEKPCRNRALEIWRELQRTNIKLEEHKLAYDTGYNDGEAAANCRKQDEIDGLRAVLQALKAEVREVVKVLKYFDEHPRELPYLKEHDRYADSVDRLRKIGGEV